MKLELKLETDAETSEKQFQFQNAIFVNFDRFKMAEKAYTSAVVLIPPEDQWPQVQEIRKQYDKAFERWMPHVNLMYPFIPEAKFATELKKVVLPINPFTITFEELGHFVQGANSTLYAKPTADFKREQMLNTMLKDFFPYCDDLNKISSAGFQAHMTLGQFPTSEIIDIKAKFQQKWKPIKYVVNSVQVISRTDSSPFSVKHVIPFGAPGVAKSTLLTCASENSILEKVKKWLQTRNNKEHRPKTKEKLERSVAMLCEVRVDADWKTFMDALEELGITVPNTSAAAKLKYNFSGLSSSGGQITKRLLETKLVKTTNFKGLSNSELEEVLSALNSIVAFLSGPSAPTNLAGYTNVVKQFARWKRDIPARSIVEKLISSGAISLTVDQETNEEIVTYHI